MTRAPMVKIAALDGEPADLDGRTGDDLDRREGQLALGAG